MKSFDLTYTSLKIYIDGNRISEFGFEFEINYRIMIRFGEKAKFRESQHGNFRHEKIRLLKKTLNEKAYKIHFVLYTYVHLNIINMIQCIETVEMARTGKFLLPFPYIQWYIKVHAFKVLNMDVIFAFESLLWYFIKRHVRIEQPLIIHWFPTSISMRKCDFLNSIFSDNPNKQYLLKSVYETLTQPQKKEKKWRASEKNLMMDRRRDQNPSYVFG